MLSLSAFIAFIRYFSIQHKENRNKCDIHFVVFLVSFGDTSCSCQRISESIAARSTAKIRSVSY
jgi:hypothetical protein